jgi:putative endonuclease
MITVYVIKSRTRNYTYVGQTNDIDRRLFDHNNGYNKTTKPYCPFELIYSESAPDRTVAREREKFLKSTSGKRFLKNLLNSH